MVVAADIKGVEEGGGGVARDIALHRGVVLAATPATWNRRLTIYQVWRGMFHQHLGKCIFKAAHGSNGNQTKVRLTIGLY